ncbi:gamma-glutamyltransferase [Caballeronia hypogeia]|uniref:Glutathione hydrolase proenzyme n=2 Tax=Caballeronia hypogeia TaxID=1777140 RepID=A0A158ABR2_9BURK|nr:gamma-glutamyltransferase [Caballeronia hypogeia]
MDVKRALRPMNIGRSGAVASNHPVATQAGLDVLRAGGNAVDAAVAVSLAIGVVEPHMSGLGGDGFYHCFFADTAQGLVYNGSGFAPQAAVTPGMSSLPLRGPGSVSVPGGVGALGLMHSQKGRIPWAELVGPAIDAAINGFGVTHVYQRFASRYADQVRPYAYSAKLFLRDGEAPAIGGFIVQPHLAASLETLARDGADSLYRGDLAALVAADMRDANVLITAAELASYEAQVQTPIAVTYRGYEVRQTPPNSTGFVLLQALKLVEARLPKDTSDFFSPDVVHTLIEAKKLAFVEREKLGADPEHFETPMRTILDFRRLEALAESIDPRKSAIRPVRPSAGDGNTTYFCVVDRWGNAVSAIQSLNNSFGSGVTLERTGILLNNRMNCWHLDDAHPNKLMAGKRVRHTMNAPMVLKDGKVWAVFGTPGADDQVQTNLQVAVGLIDFNLDPQSLAEAPRWSSSQGGQGANWPHGGDNALTIEDSFPAQAKQGLRDRGHHLVEVPYLDGPCSVACIRVLENGARVAASDPRRDGWAAAY